MKLALNPKRLSLNLSARSLKPKSLITNYPNLYHFSKPNVARHRILMWWPSREVPEHVCTFDLEWPWLWPWRSEKDFQVIWRSQNSQGRRRLHFYLSIVVPRSSRLQIYMALHYYLENAINPWTDLGGAPNLSGSITLSETDPSTPNSGGGGSTGFDRPPPKLTPFLARSFVGLWFPR